MSSRAKDWLLQAQSDLDFAKEAVKIKYYSQACFISQQASEKALKAMAFLKGVDQIKSHSIGAIAKGLGINGEILEAGQVLDLYYISARYPDGLPEGAPFQAFSLKQAQEAVSLAEKIIQKVTNEFK